jgi:hypothetical protein
MGGNGAISFFLGAATPATIVVCSWSRTGS